MPTSREMKELRALQTRKGREENGRFLAEGIRVVEDLLESPLPIQWIATSSTLEDTERGRALVESIDRHAVPRSQLDDREFLRTAGTENSQGVIAVAEIPRLSIDAMQLSDPPHVVLVLDAVQDPGNFGTMLRSAEALGAVGVVALPGTVDPWNPKSVRAAAGSSFRIPVVQLDADEAFTELRRLGFKVLGAEVGGRDIAELRGDRVAIVLGNEGAGLSSEVRDAVDAVAAVPLRGPAESLNVAAAAAILLYELTR